MESGKTHNVKRLLGNELAWADFLISKASLVLASVVLFAALFQLAAGFKDIEAQEELDFLARDFKASVDKVRVDNFPGETQEISYRFDENEVFLASHFGEGIEVYVSGEYVHLKAESGGENFSALKAFYLQGIAFQ